MPDPDIRDQVAAMAMGRALWLRHNRPDLVNILEQPADDDGTDAADDGRAGSRPEQSDHGHER